MSGLPQVVRAGLYEPVNRNILFLTDLFSLFWTAQNETLFSVRLNKPAENGIL